jgi:hypothetical protein
MADAAVAIVVSVTVVILNDRLGNGREGDVESRAFWD